MTAGQYRDRVTSLATRLQGIAPTIFTEMSALAVRTGSVNLGQGFPDEDGPPAVIAEAVAGAASTAPTSTRPAPASPSSGRRSRATSSATTGSSSTPTARSW